MNTWLPSAHSSTCNPTGAPRPAAVYANYRALHRRAATRSDAAAQSEPRSAPLALCCGMNAHGAEAAIASVLFGASFLGIEDDAHLQKSAQKNRACDFLVNSVDEALRMLKIAVRKSQPIAVGLLANPADALAQLAARGVQPQFLFGPVDPAIPTNAQPALALLENRGAQLLLPADQPTLAASETWLHWIAATRSDLARIDAQVLSLLPPEQALPRHWLQHAPAYFLRHSAPERVCSLPRTQLAALCAALQSPTLRALLHGPATLTWTDADAQPHTLSITP